MPLRSPYINGMLEELKRFAVLSLQTGFLFGVVPAAIMFAGLLLFFLLAALIAPFLG